MGTPQFPDLGKHCSVDDCKLIDFLPFTCDRCKKVLIRQLALAFISFYDLFIVQFDWLLVKFYWGLTIVGAVSVG